MTCYCLSQYSVHFCIHTAFISIVLNACVRVCDCLCVYVGGSVSVSMAIIKEYFVKRLSYHQPISFFSLINEPISFAIEGWNGNTAFNECEITNRRRRRKKVCKSNIRVITRLQFIGQAARNDALKCVSSISWANKKNSFIL